MIKRPSRASVNIRIAQLISERSTCERLHVGAVVTKNNRIIGTGYNGPDVDKPHCSPEVCNTDTPCRRAIHAEANALNNSILTHNHGPLFSQDLHIYCTHQPCLICAMLIVAHGINTVYYITPYRDNGGLELLLLNNIDVIQLDEQGNQIKA